MAPQVSTCRLNLNSWQKEKLLLGLFIALCGVGQWQLALLRSWRGDLQRGWSDWAQMWEWQPERKPDNTDQGQTNNGPSHMTDTSHMTWGLLDRHSPL